MVTRAGLPNEDLEFVQFHPTGMFPQLVRRFLNHFITRRYPDDRVHVTEVFNNRFVEKMQGSHHILFARKNMFNMFSIEMNVVCCVF